MKRLTPSPLSNSIRRAYGGKSLSTLKSPQQGFTLVETILGIGIVMAMGVGSFMVYSHVSNNKDVRTEQDNLQVIATQTEKSYAALGNFTGLTTASAISAKIVPAKMVSGTTLRSTWGTAVNLEPTNAAGKTNNALKVIYDAVPQNACAKLAAATAQGSWDILINNESVLSSGSELNVSKATNLCADKAASKMEFTYYSGASGLAATALAPVQLAPYVPPAPVTPTAPPAPLPAIPPTVVPPGVVTPPSVVPPVIPPITTTPTTPPSTPPPGVTPPVGASCVLPSPSRATETENQTGVCPSGQLLASGASTFQQTRTRTNIASCPDPWGTPVWTNGSWSNWNPGPSDVCAPACSAPGPSSVQQNQAAANQSQTLGCPAGQTGSITQIRSVTQSRTATTTYACPAPTGAFTSSTTYTGWADSSYGAWQTTSNTCVTPTPPPPPPPACAAPGNYTISSITFKVTSGSSSRTVNPYTFGRLEYGSNSSSNLEVEGTVLGVFNGQPFTGRVRARQTPTLRGTGTCSAVQGTLANSYLDSCGGGGLPPGLDLTIFMANNSQAQMSSRTLPCP